MNAFKPALSLRTGNRLVIGAGQACFAPFTVRLIVTRVVLTRPCPGKQPVLSAAIVGAMSSKIVESVWKASGSKHSFKLPHVNRITGAKKIASDRRPRSGVPGLATCKLLRAYRTSPYHVRQHCRVPAFSHAFWMSCRANVLLSRRGEGGEQAC